MALTKPEGAIEQAEMKLAGHLVRFFDSPIEHNFKFTPAVSFFIECDDEREFDEIVRKLAEEGEFLMRDDNYGFSRKFAWLNDRFSVSCS